MSEQRKIYLESVPLEEALARFRAALAAAGWQGQMERVPVETALGRVTAAPVPAGISSPHYHAAAMDGVAVRAADTFGATETAPVRLRLGTPATWVDTGDPLPAGCDAVIMVEELNRVGEGEVEVYTAAAPWQHVRPIGEDLVATELVLAAGQPIGPPEIGALLAAGVLTVPVWRQPRVTFIPTGTELVQPRSDPAPGDIIEFNSRVVLAMVSGWGGEPRRHEIVRDDPAALQAAIAAAVADSDIVVVNAGSSAGREDFTVHVLQAMGQVVVHGVALRPGKPVMLSVVQGRPVLGLPGYPVSTWLTADLFLQPLVRQFQGLWELKRPRVEARLARRLASPMGVDDFVRVRLGRVGEQLVATPLARGAGVISSLVRADGMLVVPRNLEGVEEGAQVHVALLRPRSEIDRSVVVSGSHDIILDLLAGLLRQASPWHLSSAHVGSQAGLVALRRGEAHMAGVHLLNPETGEYNTSYVHRYLGRPARLVLLCHRIQGLLVAKGNPKGIRGFADLVRPDVVFVNRQRGAGTRILLDHHLKLTGLDAEQIHGYRREEFTHLTVAAAVAAGAADCGLGILAAARALGTDFIPVAEEEYELCVPEEHWEHSGVQAVLQLASEAGFNRQVTALGGYKLPAAPRVRRVG